MTQQETNVWRAILLAMKHSKLFRNQRYKGQIVTNGKITKAWANCGVGGDGGGDLIGWTPKLILPEHVGKTVAVYTNFEAKTDTGRASDEQKHMIETIRHDGGIAGITRGAEDAQSLVDGWAPSSR